jgi:hypothetical protein
MYKITFILLGLYNLISYKYLQADSLKEKKRWTASTLKIWKS